MKRLTYLLLAFLVLATTAFGQKRNIDIESFTRIDFNIPGTLYLRQGDEVKVAIECSENALDQIDFEMRGNRLSIRNRDKSWSSWKNNDLRDVKVFITMKDIEGVRLSGSGDIYGDGAFRTSDLDIAVSGSGSIEMSISSNDLEVSLSGSGKLKLNGQADEVDLQISGSGTVIASELKVTSLDANISGSGKCEMEVKEEIKANISGSGSIYYKGSPSRINANTSGSGKVRKY